MQTYSNIKNFESLLAYHCAPTFNNLKPANLISISLNKYSDVNYLLNIYSLKFKKMGISIKKLCECSKYILVLVYRPKSLIDYIHIPSINNFLLNYGYKYDSCIDSYLNTLISHFNNCIFPHEIGVFLGYPLCDVKGFIENKGNNFKYSGYWKVYDNVLQTKKKFNEYTLCRDLFYTKISNGTKLESLLIAS